MMGFPRILHSKGGNLDKGFAFEMQKNGEHIKEASHNGTEIYPITIKRSIQRTYHMYRVQSYRIERADKLLLTAKMTPSMCHSTPECAVSLMLMC